MMTTWVIPCNVRFFDIQAYINSNHNEVVWQTSRTMEVNDVVYLYLGRGPSEIKYKGHITKAHLNNETIQEHSYAVRPTTQRKDYVMIRIDKTYPDGTFPLIDLRFHGLKQLQRQSRATDKLLAYIKSKDIE